MTCEDPGLAPEIRAALCHNLICLRLEKRGIMSESHPQVYDQLRYQVVSAARTWEPGRGCKFITYAWNSCVLAMQDTTREIGRTPAYLRAEEEYANRREKYRRESEKAADAFLVAEVGAALSSLDPRDAATLREWMDAGFSGSEAARRAGVSSQAFNDRLRRAKASAAIALSGAGYGRDN